MANGFRGVIHPEDFEREFKELEPNPQIRDQILEGIDWILSRVPEEGAFSEGHGVWIREVSDPVRRRRFYLFYTFSDQHVILLSIRPPDPFSIWPE